VAGEDQRQIRVDFSLAAGKTVASALASVAAPGCHVMQVNGQPAGDQHGMCPWLQYNKRILYQTRNLTDLVTAGGDNTIGIMLGHGFWTDLFSAPVLVKAVVCLGRRRGVHVYRR
jgi:alpha-L-rhamnosidase